MPEPLIAKRKPCLETVRAGKKYFWCSCGRSAKQPGRTAGQSQERNA